ncbi:MAG: DUF488 family protein, partial [Bryobacteraceae bacterium]
MTIYTIGHSTRPADEFARILRAYGIELLADIRTVPRSRKNPQYDQEEFKRLLAKERITYRHLAGLGGLRHARKDSLNTAWKNASFRGYADYMQTPEFTRALEELIALAAEQTTAIMCAEAVPWRCHRSLVADALLVRGIRVADIIASSPPREHKLTSFARVRGVKITYPAGQSGVPSVAR